MRHSSPALVCVSLLLSAVLASSASASEPELSLPRIHVHAKPTTVDQRRVLLVKAISVIHNPNVAVRVTCEHCPRLTADLPRVVKVSPQINRYLGLDWAIGVGRYVQVIVTQPGAIGRYLTLAAKHPLRANGLTVIASGCLNAQRQQISCSGAAPQLPTPKTPQTAEFSETAGGETHPWSDYSNGSGQEGKVIPAEETVSVSCRVEGLVVSDGDPWWYRISSTPWSNAFYASSDAFYNNGQTSGTLIGTPPYDPQVPIC